MNRRNWEPRRTMEGDSMNRTDPQPIENHRDHLFVTLTAMWPRLANKSASPEEYARYWTLQQEYEQACDELQAALLELPEPPPIVPDPYPLCPQCKGQGWIGTSPIIRCQDTGEWLDDPIDCPSCGGLGVLAPPYGQPVEIDTAAVASWL